MIVSLGVGKWNQSKMQRTLFQERALVRVKK
jgi:hypothetical protein